MYYLGVDTGGTFTDFVLFSRASREIQTFKVRSNPSDPAAAVAEGLERMRTVLRVAPAELERLIFGTTVATNAVLELKGGKTALLTTRGIRDVLEIQRQWRRRLFDLYLQKPEPLVPRRHRLEVTERVDARGEVLVPLTQSEIDRCVEELATLPVEAVAICLLFSFLRPEHEQALAAAIRRQLPQLHVTVSSDVSPEFREYERTATTVMNAYTMPKIHRLASRLEEVLRDVGFKGTFGIIQSNGGLMSLEKTRTHPVNTLLSGPAGGVVGAVAIAKDSGIGNVLGLDIGGTSTDLSLVENAEIRLSSEGGIGGYPVKVPQVRVHTIGAGGGSIARPVLGTLKVGPQSAGADPGPVCYGTGGTEPTSTDAALCLGYIDPEYFLGGEMRLDVAGARGAIEEKVGKPLRLSLDEAMLAIVKVQVSTIVAGIRAVSVEAGHDPRDFALLPFGGAGGLYAGLIAEEANIGRIIIPPHPSVLSALGMLMTDIRHDLTATRLMALDDRAPAQIAEICRELAGSAERMLAADRIPPDRIRLEASCDLRYVGQAYEINVLLPGVASDFRCAPDALRRAFHDEHRRVYGHAAEDEPVEIVNVRMAGIGVVDKARLVQLPEQEHQLPPPKRYRRALFDLSAGWQDCPVYERAELPVGTSITGPAIIEERGASIPIYPGHRLAVDCYGNMIVAVRTVTDPAT